MVEEAGRGARVEEAGMGAMVEEAGVGRLLGQEWAECDADFGDTRCTVGYTSQCILQVVVRILSVFALSILHIKDGIISGPHL